MPKAVRVVVIGLRSVTESPRAQVSCPNSSEWMISMFIAWPHGVGCRAFMWAVLSVLIPKKLLTGSARNMEQKLASTRGRHVALHRSRAKHRLPHKCQSKDGGDDPSNSSRMKGGESCKTAEVGPVERKDVSDPMGVH